jgi:hypothetical protein
LKIVEKGKSLFITFRSYENYEYPELRKSKNIVQNLKTASKLEKPWFVIISLQKNRKNNIINDSSIFNNCKLTILNSVIYLYDNLNIDFTKKKSCT